MPQQKSDEINESTIVNCCYVCDNRMFIVAGNRCGCKLDKKYRAVFARCKKFIITTDEKVIAIAMKLSKPTDKWYP
jgi:hypothetical protein